MEAASRSSSTIGKLNRLKLLSQLQSFSNGGFTASRVISRNFKFMGYRQMFGGGRKHA